MLQDLSRVDGLVEDGPRSTTTTTTTTTRPVPNADLDDDDEVWNVGARYSIEDLQTLAATGGRNSRKRFSPSNFDIFAYDTTPPPKPPKLDDENNIDPTDQLLPTEETYRSAAQSRSEWNGSVLDVEYRKHLYPHLNAKFEWNSISNIRIINLLDNSRRWVLHHIWYTKTARELIATFFAAVATFNFVFIAWLLMTFIEPPEEVHFIHYYKCFTETTFAYATMVVNAIMTVGALSYLFLTFCHYKGVISMPILYKIKPFQK